MTWTWGISGEGPPATRPPPCWTAPAGGPWCRRTVAIPRRPVAASSETRVQVDEVLPRRTRHQGLVVTLRVERHVAVGACRREVVLVEQVGHVGPDAQRLEHRHGAEV